MYSHKKIRVRFRIFTAAWDQSHMQDLWDNLRNPLEALSPNTKNNFRTLLQIFASEPYMHELRLDLCFSRPIKLCGIKNGGSRSEVPLKFFQDFLRNGGACLLWTRIGFTIFFVTRGLKMKLSKNPIETSLWQLCDAFSSTILFHVCATCRYSILIRRNLILLSFMKLGDLWCRV